jgi:hypothetical protein
MFLLAVAAQLISIGAVFLMGHTISRHTRMLGKKALVGIHRGQSSTTSLAGAEFLQVPELVPNLTRLQPGAALLPERTA